MIKAVIFDMYETLITHYDSPLYFSAEMAADIGIPTENFRRTWKATMSDRTTGKMSLEQVLEQILRENHCYSGEMVAKIAQGRVDICEDCFRHLHEEIIPMLEKLKENGIQIGLISNCFSEEAVVIRKSILAPYFDAICLSYEAGLEKPDLRIYETCMNMLQVTAEECIYIGDGGSSELEAARAIGMKEMQATWYLKEGTLQVSRPKEGFLQLKRPLEVLEHIT